MEENKSCNKCKCSVIKKIDVSDTPRYNLYCGALCKNRCVDFSVPHNAFVEIPSWCPLDYGKKEEEKTTAKRGLSFSEKMDKIRNMKPITPWNEIKEKTVYHVPQFPGEERKDILITHKSEYSLTYKVVGETKFNISYTLYPSTPMSKFLIPNKIKKYKVISKSSNK